MKEWLCSDLCAWASSIGESFGWHQDDRAGFFDLLEIYVWIIGFHLWCTLDLRTASAILVPYVAILLAFRSVFISPLTVPEFDAKPSSVRAEEDQRTDAVEYMKSCSIEATIIVGLRKSRFATALSK